MPTKTILKCVICGKERMGYESSIVSPVSSYKCKKCTTAQHNLNQKSKKVTYKCVNCGEERTSSKSHFKKSESEYRCKKCASILRRVEKEKRACIECGKERIAYKWEFNKSENEYRCPTCKNKVLSKDPNWIKRNIEGSVKRKEDPLWKESIQNGILKRSKNMSWVNMMFERNQTLHQNMIYKENHLISTTGQGFWYGHPIINNDSRPKYCEIFEEVKPRVRAFFNHSCTKCGKLETTESFNVHHVFYEKKTCCWVDDSGHYWTNLNIKSHPQDYYIGENPNYFALLCDSCHGTTNGKYENRKKSADELRKLIDEKFLGKSYLTKEEYEIYKNNIFVLQS